MLQVKSMIIHHPIKSRKRNPSHEKNPARHAKDCYPQRQAADLRRHDSTDSFIDPGQGIDEGNSLHDW